MRIFFAIESAESVEKKVIIMKKIDSCLRRNDIIKILSVLCELCG
jgi:hypothetical protein